MLLTGLEIRKASRGKLGWFCIKMIKKLGSMLNRLDSSCEKNLDEIKKNIYFWPMLIEG